MNTMMAEEQFATGGLPPEGAAVATPGIAMGGNNIYMFNSTGVGGTGGNFFAQGGNIAMGNSVAGGGAGGGTLYMNSGSVDMTSGGAILMGNGCTLRASAGGGTLPNPSPPPAGLSDGATGTLTIGTAGITPCDFEADSIFAENIQASNSLFAGSYIYNSSDGRLKKDIEPLPDDMLDRLLALQPVSFRWKRNNQKETGFIAQDLQKQFPELVATAPNGFLALQIDGLIAPIVEALKELRAQNESLRERLDAIAKSSRSSVAFQKSHETDSDPDSTASPDTLIVPIMETLRQLKAENEELQRQATQNQKEIDELKKHPCADSL
jgi:propanediol dehydratase small subunit